MSYTNPPLTNNPFIPNYSHPSDRYPDISPPPTTTWTDPTLSAVPQQQYPRDIYPGYPQTQQPETYTGYTQQQVPFHHQQQQQQQQQQQAQNYPSSYPHSPTSFQPSSSFGQNLQASIPGSRYGYLQSGQQQPPPQNAYNPPRSQLQNPNYVGQLDPFGPIPQGWADTSSTQSQSHPLSPPVSNNSNARYSNGNPINSGPPGFSPSNPHPREYIRSHKQEIEAWDRDAWQHLLNSFKALTRAWETRESELKARQDGLQGQFTYSGYYDRTQMQQEIMKIQGLLNDAKANSESVAVCKFQLDEAFQGYRQSGDKESKGRVREATNAALHRLPNWPQ